MPLNKSVLTLHVYMGSRWCCTLYICIISHMITRSLIQWSDVKREWKTDKQSEDAMLLISVRQGFSGIRKAVYSSVKCFVNCVLNTKWAVSICKGRWSHKNKLFLNSCAWPGNGLIRDKSQLLLLFFFPLSLKNDSIQVTSGSPESGVSWKLDICYDTDLSCS